MHDPLSAFFLICFLFGSGLALVTFVTGAAHLTLPGAHALHLGHLHLPGGHAHLGHLPHPHAVHGSNRESASPLNLGSLLAFLAWFGGAGYLLHALSPLALILVFLLAAIAGLGGGALIFTFLARVLLPAQTFVDPAVYRLDGTPAKVTAGILPGATGEITYSKAGTRRSDAARNIDAEGIPRGDEVVILSYQHGIAYVQTMKRYLGSSASELAGRIVALERDATPDAGQEEK